jgi:hypothetical protein
VPRAPNARGARNNHFFLARTIGSASQVRSLICVPFFAQTTIGTGVCLMLPLLSHCAVNRRPLYCIARIAVASFWPSVEPAFFKPATITPTASAPASSLAIGSFPNFAFHAATNGFPTLRLATQVA